ncbi:MAG: hypothetical protein WA945_05285 [Arcobacteraceae bacterium]
MKILLQIIVTVFVFAGCSQTNQTVQKDTKIQNSSSYASKNVNSPAVSFFGIGDFDREKNVKNTGPVDEIAIIYPSHTIGKYALEATNSISTYLIINDNKFKLTTYDIIVQNKKNILNIIAKLKEDNVKKVIAMITKDELMYLTEVSGIENIKFYFPLINKYDLVNNSQFNSLDFTFGAISYKDQYKKLIKFAQGKKLVEFYGSSAIGSTLHEYLRNERIIYTKKIDDNNGRYNSFLTNNRRLDNSVVILNTPIVKSSILLSAINAAELEISSIVSTQLNYTPLLFSLTQKNDRTKLVIANSIGMIPNELEEYNTLIGNNLSYSWVNYATIIGVEYLLNDDIDIFEDLSLTDNQVIYPVKLYRVGNYSFRRIQ